MDPIILLSLVVITALGWGGVAALSLVLGAALALVRPWPDRLVGVVLGFGAGALISSVAFELAEEGRSSRSGCGQRHR